MQKRNQQQAKSARLPQATSSSKGPGTAIVAYKTPAQTFKVPGSSSQSQSKQTMIVNKVVAPQAVKPSLDVFVAGKSGRIMAITPKKSQDVRQQPQTFYKSSPATYNRVAPVQQGQTSWSHRSWSGNASWSSYGYNKSWSTSRYTPQQWRDWMAKKQQWSSTKAHNGSYKPMKKSNKKNMSQAKLRRIQAKHSASALPRKAATALFKKRRQSDNFPMYNWFGTRSSLEKTAKACRKAGMKVPRVGLIYQVSVDPFNILFPDFMAYRKNGKPVTGSTLLTFKHRVENVANNFVAVSPFSPDWNKIVAKAEKLGKIEKPFMTYSPFDARFPSHFSKASTTKPVTQAQPVTQAWSVSQQAKTTLPIAHKSASAVPQTQGFPSFSPYHNPAQNRPFSPVNQQQAKPALLPVMQKAQPATGAAKPHH